MVFCETCGPNEAMVVSGMFHTRPALVTGGRVFVWPVVQKLQKISLNTMTLNVESPKVCTPNGVSISVTGIAQVKVQGQNQEILYAACEQFLSKSTEQISEIILDTLEGHQHAVLGAACYNGTTVQEMCKDLKRLSQSIFEIASSDLVNMGISIVSYTITDIHYDKKALLLAEEAKQQEEKMEAKYNFFDT